jgi:cyclophilin family peptidyl-prolyl cis-trans isomerase
MLRLLVTLIAVLWSVASFAANPQVELKTNMGAIVLELYPERVPATVKSFIQYVKDGHYDGTVFHRIIPKFMIQGGGFTLDFKQKPTRQPIRNEAANGIKNTVGTVAMARTSDPHSATAQFFINIADNDFLDFRYPTREGYGYCAFGRVIKGMDVVQRMASVTTGPGPGPHRDVPRQPVVIERATVLEAAAPAAEVPQKPSVAP